MPVGVRLKRTHDTGPRVSSGVRPKKSAGSPRSKDQSSGNAKRHRNEHESDTAGYCGEPYRRGRKMDHGAESNVKFKRGEFDSEFAHHKRKGFNDEGRRTQGFRVSNRKSFAMDGKRTMGDDLDSVNGRHGDVKFVRKKPSKPPKWKRTSPHRQAYVDGKTTMSIHERKASICSSMFEPPPIRRYRCPAIMYSATHAF